MLGSYERPVAFRPSLARGLVFLICLRKKAERYSAHDGLRSRKKDLDKPDVISACEQKKEREVTPPFCCLHIESLFRMGNDVAEEVTILLDGEIKPPAPRYAGLPDALDLFVLLRP
jgi:hypothetical protein